MYGPPSLGGDGVPDRVPLLGPGGDGRGVRESDARDRRGRGRCVVRGGPRRGAPDDTPAGLGRARIPGRGPGGPPAVRPRQLRDGRGVPPEPDPGLLGQDAPPRGTGDGRRDRPRPLLPADIGRPRRGRGDVRAGQAGVLAPRHTRRSRAAVRRAPRFGTRGLRAGRVGPPDLRRATGEGGGPTSDPGPDVRAADTPPGPHGPVVSRHAVGAVGVRDGIGGRRRRQGGEAARARIDLDDEGNYRDLSRPIGALNEERYKGFEARYESLLQSQGSGDGGSPLDAPFLYGTHYSAPGYVLYYLLRTMPQHMLCLQNGRFDVPDRLFHSVGSTYRSALDNPADVKELIPEMFDPDCSDFLINSGGLRLGSLQTGERVDDVLLPPWARGARHFVRTNRRALESDVCTRGLHRWIDLVFGSRSRGLRARDAGNLFHPLTYLGPSDVGGLPEGERRRAEAQSAEFGMTPDMIFCLDHPPRGSAPLDGGRAIMTRDALRESYAAEGRPSF
ncbi:hypothetical protein THAOC_14235 [Thalassiosira oceanica]|uniref:BEACH domain-containing protein n=1 Tax=Thalassiosira oceanica TaxID=159749 RepID=K0T3G0_THAOC|nr:hypothetical protein THAOC_14235 [Thalassiosira oceanica]|eukprot:EJK64972.1 hypothetical protein THAOC_14235 [Thalassiosira oceanica]